MQQMEPISVMIGGAAGDGVMQAGRMFGLALVRAGFHVFITTEYPSLIRGGHNTAHIRLSNREVWAHSKYIDFLIALNKETIDLHIEEMSDGGTIIVDEKIRGEIASEHHNVNYVYVPMSSTIKELKAPLVVRNMVALGALFSLIGLPLNYMKSVIEDTFGDKTDIVKVNLAALEKGFYSYKEKRRIDLSKFVGKERKILLTGNEAIGLASIKAGLKFFAAYPITPASPLLHFLSKYQFDKNIVVLQAESEIAAINMIMGASYAGVRSMTATSGTGFGLMVEGFGALAMAECPAVIALAMRPGPGSGMPTFTTQADLRFILHASHGEFARVVIAPGDVEEAFYLTGVAFNLADKYRIPVVILYDKFLGESYKSINSLDEEKITVERGKIQEGKDGDIEVFLNYNVKEEPPYSRLIPGTRGYIVNANITEHDETGWSKIVPAVREKMAQRRINKLYHIEKENLEWVKFYGNRESRNVVLAWGSTKGPILEAMRHLKNEGIELGFIQVVFMSPFPKGKIAEHLKSTSTTILIENNYTAQLGSLLEEHLHYTVDFKLTRDNGLPFTPEEVAEFIKEVIVG